MLIMINLTQEEITKNWNKESETPLVSIRCMAYNHELYIEQALTSFLMQETDFPFEIIVHDDASTDNTAEIIRKYATKYPQIIRPIYEKENQYSKRDGSLAKIMDQACRGKYVAVCEGDDYWTDSKKLMRQIHFLETHPDYSISSENGNILFTDTNKIIPFSCEKEHDISLEDLLIKRRFPTASVVYQKKFLEGYDKLSGRSFDTKKWAYLSTKGKVHFNPVISSIYRRGSGVTETNHIKWAYTSESFNATLKSNFRLTRTVKKARSRILYNDYKRAWKTAKKENLKEEQAKLLKKMLFLAPTLIFRDLIKKTIMVGGKKLITNFWNFYYKISPAKKLQATDRTIPIIVTLTSHPARFETLHLCIKSILNQKLQPNKIVLYLDKTVSLSSLPSQLLKLQKKGLIIRNICEDIKPHNKYFYAMQEFPDSAIVTIDDDVIYPKDMVSSLYNSFIKNPKAISARRIHEITRNNQGENLPYNSWNIEIRHTISNRSNAFATGVGGVLYPPRLFDFSKPYLQINTIIEHCLLADDIWLAFIEKLINVPICHVPPKHVYYYDILNPKCFKSALQNKNVFENRNDIYIQKCERYFNIKL